MPAEVAVLIKAKDETGKAFDKVEKELKGFERVAEDTTNEVGDHFERLERISTATLAIATVGALRDVSEEMTEMARTGAKVESTRRTFEQFLQTVGGDAPVALDAFRKATRNTLSDMDAMAAANRFLGMGLASTVDEAAELLEASTQLATAMGKTAKEGAEEFALMLANQSVPRMDTFALSSGRARERILELMEASEDMTREQAFTQVVMEQSREKMAELGDTLQGTAGDMARAQAKSENFSNSLAERLSPVLSKISMPLKTFSDMVAPAGQLAMGLGGLGGVLPGVGRGISDMSSAAANSISSLTGATQATEGLTAAGVAAKASLAEVVVVLGAITAAAYIFEKEITPRLGLPDIPDRLTQVKDALHFLQLGTTDYIRTILGYEPIHEKVRKRLMDDLQLYGKITKETKEWIKTQEALAKEGKEYYGIGKKEEELIIRQTEAREDATEATDDLAYAIQRAMWHLEDEMGTLDDLSDAWKDYGHDALEYHELVEQDLEAYQRHWEEMERERVAKGRQMASEWYEAQSSVYTELGTEHLNLRQRMEAEEQQHTAEMNRLSQERTKEAQAAMDAEIARHNTVIGALQEERDQMMATSAFQLLANRRYEDGTTALSRLFGENIETAQDFFDITHSGFTQLSEKDMKKVWAVIALVEKEQSRNQLRADQMTKAWDKQRDAGKKLYGEIVSSMESTDPAFREIFLSQEAMIDQILEGKEPYEDWGRTAVRNIEDVDSEMYGLDHTAITHHSTVAMIGSAYEITAQRAASAIRSIPAWPQPPTWTAPYVPTPTPIAPLPIWYPGYQSGGTVPGPVGRPQMAMVHGGETITPPGRGGGITFDFRGAQFYGITQDFVEDLFRENETLLKLQGVRAGVRA